MEQVNQDLVYLNEEKTQVFVKIKLDGDMCWFKYKITTNKNRKKERNFKCVDKKCKASINISETDELTQKLNTHTNHEELSEAEVACELEFQRIIKAIMSNLSTNVPEEHEKSRANLVRVYDMRLIKWPKYTEWRQNYQYYVKRAKEVQKIRAQKEEGDIVKDLLDSEEYKFTRYKSLFFRYRSTFDSPNQFMIYFSDKGKEIIKNSRKAHFDGTFKAVPKPYKQLLSLHAYYQGRFYVCAYIFLCDKSQDSYVASLLRLKELMDNEVTFEIVITDFEASLQQSIAQVFGPNITIKGCWFHFNQALMRRMDLHGLRHLYRHDLDFKLWIRQFGALALISEKDLVSAFNIILDKLKSEWLDEKLIKFMQYFNNTWLVSKRGTHMSPSVWMVGDLDTRTNNDSEGFHSKLNKKITSRPDLFNLIQVLISIDEEEMLGRIQAEQLPIKPKLQRREDRIKDAILSSIKNEYDTNLITFDQYFYKLTNQVTYPYGEENAATIASDSSDDHIDDSEESNSNEDTLNNDISSIKVYFTNVFKNENFLKRIDTSKKEILPIDKANTLSNVILVNKRKRKQAEPTSEPLQVVNQDPPVKEVEVDHVKIHQLL